MVPENLKLIKCLRNSFMSFLRRFSSSFYRYVGLTPFIDDLFILFVGFQATILKNTCNDILNLYHLKRQHCDRALLFVIKSQAKLSNRGYCTQALFLQNRWSQICIKLRIDLGMNRLATFGRSTH